MATQYDKGQKIRIRLKAYDHKLLDQSTVAGRTDPGCGHVFPAGSSGPLGDRIEGDWLPYAEMVDLVHKTAPSVRVAEAIETKVAAAENTAKAAKTDGGQSAAATMRPQTEISRACTKRRPKSTQTSVTAAQATLVIIKSNKPASNVLRRPQKSASMPTGTSARHMPST